MRIAIVSDVHGNKPALEAVLNELEEQGPFDHIVGGGDFSVGGVYPADCIQVVRDQGWEAVRGNTEELVSAAAGDGVIPAADRQPEIRLSDADMERLGWFVDRLPDHLEYIGDLPLSWEMTGPSGQKLLFVHATPWSSHDVIKPDDTDEHLAVIIEDAGVDALLYGHIHYAYQRQVNGKLLACVGSVGAPLDNDVRPCFAIAEDSGDGWKLTHIRIAYDREPYLAELAQAGFPGAAATAERDRQAAPIV